MSEPYQVLGASNPLLLGRKSELRKIKESLAKDVADSLMLVGPKFIGKSVILRELDDLLDLPAMGYATHVYWNLSQQNPESDDDFRKKLYEQVRRQLLPARPDLKEWFEGNLEPCDALDGALDELGEGTARLLLIMDSFDSVLSSSKITRGIWDNLADLLRKPALTILTGSRRPLLDLCPSEESKNSDFWELFEQTPLRIQALSEDDLQAFVGPLEKLGFSIEKQSLNKLQNITGGVPILVSDVLRTFLSDPPREITPDDLRKAGDTILTHEAPYLTRLWRACEPDERATLARLSKSSLQSEEIPEDIITNLTRRGYVSKNRKGITCCCSIMSEYAKAHGSTSEDLQRIFGTKDKWQQRTQELLLIRLNQLSGVDPDLLQFVRTAITQLGSANPGQAVYNCRGISERALNLISKAEFPHNEIDQEVAQKWKTANGGKGEGGIKGVLRSLRVPRKSAEKRTLLLILTGSEHSTSQAKYITKSTALLISHLWDTGNPGVHQEEEHVFTSAFAASCCFAAVELCSHLASELPS